MMLCSRCKKNVAVVFVTKLENNKTTNEGLCLACAKELGIDISKSMQSLNVNPEDFENIGNQISDMLGLPEDIEMPDISEMQNFFNTMMPENSGETPQDSDTGKKEKTKKQKKRILDSYSTNLTKKAAEGRVDVVVGRDEEITRCIEVLNRRTKNNPCLIGEPGVGKTAIAEGLATRIVAGDVPEKLLNYEIYLLDFTAIVAGTQFRGQFEARLKNIIEEVKKAGNIILVIDELHNIVAAGDADGAMSAANILKPALARGEIQVIGATTTNEYRKFIEKDSALERRFQPILVEEPSPEETIDIIKGIKKYYEDYHKVTVSDEIIRLAVELSRRYITDRYMPDKAIDVIDEAASGANLKNTALLKAAKLRSELEKVSKELDEAEQNVEDNNFQAVADLKTHKCQLEEELKLTEGKSLSVPLTAEDIAAVIERWTKIPASRITMDENKRLLDLENTLKKRVKGQDAAISAVSAAIRRSRVGLAKKRRPVSMLFTGPTGVGKTELVLSLAEAVFDSENALIRLDMSEYMEKHAVSKIIGSPPGYVGYDDAGQLTEKVRRKPYSIILLDEIEKAHPEVLNILLQIFEDGRITDSHGKTVDFKNTIIIMTSNIGSDYKGNAPGYTSDNALSAANKVKSAMREFFRPEFLNRIDEIIVFKPLEHDALMEILSKLLSEFSECLSSREINFDISDDAKELLLKNGYDPKNGARPLRRVIQQELENKAAYMIISGVLTSGDTLYAVVGDEKIVLYKGAENETLKRTAYNKKIYPAAN